jgi:hypothetical protein
LTIITISAASRHNKGLVTVALTYNYPVSVYEEHGTKKVGNLRDTILISTFEDVIVYTLPSTNKFETNEPVTGTHRYFVFSRNQPYGYLLHSPTDSFRKGNLKVDSFLNASAMGTLNFNIPPDSSWSLVKADDPGGVFVEKYFLKRAESGGIPDSICFYFDPKLQMSAFTLSKSLDSVKKAKLFMARLIFDAKDSCGLEIVPKREFSFQLRPVRTERSNDLITIAKRFMKK